MTFSIAARCARTGRFVVAVASSSPAVAARCAFARAGVGAATTQNITDPRLGPQGLNLMALGADADAACHALRRTAPHVEFRQFSLIDANGGTACFSGQRVLGVHAAEQGKDVVSAGNLLANPEVPAAIVRAFESADADEELGDRIMTAMQAGLTAGGEAGPIHSAGLIIVDAVAWPIADLRVDWHDAPIEELRRLWLLWKPQMTDYITRALNPETAPTYGVPGDV